MAAGLELYNDAGVAITLDWTKNLTLIQSGVASVGSNTTATGYTAVVMLPAATQPYMVFIRCSGNAQIISAGTDRFAYFLAQGTTSMNWYAFNSGMIVGGNVGMQVYAPNGSLQWELGAPPMVLSFLDTSGTVVPYDNATGTGNLYTPTTGGSYTIPSNCAVLYNQLGSFIDVYFPFTGSRTVQSDTRFVSTISTNGTNLQMRWGRMYPNFTRPAGLNQTFYANFPPDMALLARIPGL